LSPPFLVLEGADGTGASDPGFRCGEPQFGPDGLAREAALGHAPAVREGVDEEQAPAGLGLGGGRLRPGEPVTPRVGDLDAEGAGDHVEREPEVPSRDAAVGRRVDGQLGDDLAGRVHGQAPGTQLGCPEAPGLVGAAWRGGELHAEVVDGGGGFGGSLIHVTQRGRSCLPWSVTLCVRTVTVRGLSGAVVAVPTVGTGRAPRAARTVPRERCGMRAVEAGAGRLKEEADEPGWEVDPDDEWGVAVITTVGRQLKLRREAAGLRAAEFGRIVGYGEDMVYKIEGGKRIPR